RRHDVDAAVRSYDVANGIAFNRARGTLLLTGKRWPTLYEVRVPGLSAAP
ncbi:glutaminyl-peptide cyclotransferase, partial [Deinococcus sp.]